MRNMNDTGARTRVLVVEDEPIIRMDAVDFLEEAGFSVEEAADGLQALRILARAPDLHVLFTDVNMPGDLDGLALAHLVAKEFPSIGLIIVSGRAMLKAHQLPTNAVFLAKPYQARKVVAHVHRLKRAA